MKRTLISIISLALLASACGDSAGDDPGTTGAPTSLPPENGSDVLLMITDEGGFAPIEFSLNNSPTYVILRDGTLIFRGPDVGAFPGPVLPAMQQVKLTAAQLEDIQVLIDAAGLPEVDDVFYNDAQNFVADAANTITKYWDENGEVHTISVYALGLTMDDPLPDDQANLVLLREKIFGFTMEGGAGEPYVSDELIVRIIEGGGFAEVNDTREWAFDFAPGDLTPVNGFGCLVLEGAEADSVRATLSEATIATNWEHESGTFLVLGRDLLPGENGCEA